MSDQTMDGDRLVVEKPMLTTEDGRPLKKALAIALRREKIRAFLLILPLLAFVILSFIVPIGYMLFRSVDNKIVSEILPNTVIEVVKWDPDSSPLPDELVFAAMATDLKQAVKDKTHTRIGSLLNYANPGMSSLFRKSGREINKLTDASPIKEQMIAFDFGWGDPETWRTIRRMSPNYTDSYFLNAVDAERRSDGIAKKPENERIYITLFIRTIVLSVAITLACVLLGYPIAYLLANLPARSSNLLIILVLLPFWTSLLVRTSAWKVLLQQEGVINDLLVFFRLIDDAGRLVMINNVTGTIIAMTHILLPFMILPLYSVMKTISPSFVRAAKSMGASDWTTFWKIYFPNTIPGIGAGSILVFILAIGYYITPELVGGTKGVFISNRIAYHISSSLNWGLAAALGAILLALVLVLYWAYDRMVGIDNVKLG